MKTIIKGMFKCHSIVSSVFDSSEPNNVIFLIDRVNGNDINFRSAIYAECPCVHNHGFEVDKYYDCEIEVKHHRSYNAVEIDDKNKHIATHFWGKLLSHKINKE